MLILALFLRTYNLLAIPIFADEAIYVRWAQVMRNEPTLRFLPLSDGKQPLFMWTVMGILQFFADPLIAGRIVSALSGIVSLIGIFFLAYRLFKSKEGALLAVFLYAVSPYAVFFDRMALVDSMLAVFGVWSLYFAVLTAQTLRLDTAMMTGFMLGGAWLTKSPAIFYLLLLPTVVILSKFPHHRQAKFVHFAKLLGLWLISWFIAFGIYNIQRLGPNFHLIASRNKDYVFSIGEALQHPLDPLQFHIVEIFSWFLSLLPGSILLLAIAGLAFGIKKHTREVLLVSAWIMIPLLIEAEFAKVFTARYLLFLVQLVVVLTATLTSLGKTKIRRAFFWFTIILLTLPALGIDYLLLTDPEKAPLPRIERSGYLEEWTAGTGIREIVAYTKSEIQKDPATRIVIGTEGSFGTLPDGLQIYLSDIPGITVIGVESIFINKVSSQLIGAKKAGDKAYLVVNSSRFGGDAEKLGLRMIESYAKATKPDGSYESLLFFEVTDEAISPQT